MCPGVTDEVLIAFPEQPDNGGQLFLRGDKIYAMLDFRNIPSGVEVIKHGARWYHGYDEDTGEYRYEVTYRYPGAEVSPCSGSDMEFWLLNDDVSALFWEDIFGPIK